MVRTLSMPSGLPERKLRCMLSAPSGSTPKIWTLGLSCFTAAATPAQRPPPPMGTITASSEGICSHSSSPSVAVPVAVSLPSKGWTKVRPSSASICFTLAKAAWTSSTSTTSAPKARQPSTRAGLAVFGITTLAVVPRARAA